MLQAVSFLTPFGGPRNPSPSALDWFPVVGAAVGLALGLVWWLAVKVWPAPVAAGLTLAADLAVTGMLHIDGLSDAADGLLSNVAGPKRRLEVMAEPSVGAFGLATTTVVLLLRYGALMSMPPSVLLVAALWSASRTAMAVTARAVPYARPQGLASSFLSAHTGRFGAERVALTGTVVAVVLGWLARGGAGVACLLFGGLAASAVVALARRRLGGFTGDVLGAVGIVAETVGLLVAAAHW